MTTPEVIATILTSAVVSTLVSFLLRIVFENRQQHRFEKELKRIEHENELAFAHVNNQLSTGEEVSQALNKRKLDSYPRLVELVYRTRKMARELNGRRIPSAFTEELFERTDELEDLLYKFRIDLERDSLFKPIHGYKNVLLNFNLVIKDIVFHEENDADDDQIVQLIKQLDAMCTQLDDQHGAIIHKLSLSVAPAGPSEPVAT